MLNVSQEKPVVEESANVMSRLHFKKRRSHLWDSFLTVRGSISMFSAMTHPAFGLELKGVQGSGPHGGGLPSTKGPFALCSGEPQHN